MASKELNCKYARSSTAPTRTKLTPTCCQCEHFFDLIPFHFEGQLGDPRRRPASPNPVNWNGRSAALAFQRPAEKRSFLRELQNEAEAFLGVVRVTVQ
jgi:hypothetical protein